MFRKHLLNSILLFCCSLAFSQEEPKNPFSFKWDNGFKLTSQDNQFALKFGGRIMVDQAYFFQDDALTESFGPLILKNATEIRRARLFFSGDIYENTHFKIQVDFAQNSVDLKDVYIGISNLPVIGNLRIGNQKEPFRLSTITSSKFTTFMEIGQNGAFLETRNTGILLFNDFIDDRLSAQIGAFRNTHYASDNIFTEDGYAVTGRVTGLALKNEEKKHLLHLGLAYSYRTPSSREYRISTKPSSNLAPKYISKAILKDVNNINLINFETAYTYGSFAFQGEYLNAKVNTAINSLNFSNYYGEVSYFITGEHKNYKGSYEGFGRVTPRKNFNLKDKGAGAWEIAFRYSNTDLTDIHNVGGKLHDMALGLNWYLNPVTRLMINHVWVNIEDQGNANILQGRLQIDF